MFKELLINEIEANPEQVRKTFTPQALEELKESIKIYGLLQPLVVYPHKSKYMIIAGERRFRACQQLGLEKVLCNVLPASTDPETILELCLIENIQRENLNPLEQAHGYMSLLELGYTQQEVANKLSKSRAHIANSVRLLKLPSFVQAEINKGTLSQSKALELINRKDLTEAELIELLENGCTVQSLRKSDKTFLNPEDMKHLSSHLTRSLKANVTIDPTHIKIRYTSPQDLDTLLEKLAKI